MGKRCELLIKGRQTQPIDHVIAVPQSKAVPAEQSHQDWIHKFNTALLRALRLGKHCKATLHGWRSKEHSSVQVL